jgi:hypothetical protein
MDSRARAGTVDGDAPSRCQFRRRRRERQRRSRWIDRLFGDLLGFEFDFQLFTFFFKDADVADLVSNGDVSRNEFRFLPLHLKPWDLERMHGIDERIGIREYEDAIRTYRQLVIEAAGS